MLEHVWLGKVPLFSSMKPDLLAHLAGKMSTRSYRTGETIFHKDDPGSVLYLIRSGQVKITTASEEGDEAILAILTDGDFFGELSLLDESPRSASAVAMAPTQALILHRQDFVEFLRKYPELVTDILAAVSQRLRKTDTLVEDVFFLDLSARLAKRLLELSESHGVPSDDGIEINLQLTQQDLANMVGATRVAVNKQLGFLQDRGIIRMGRQRITVLAPEELRQRIY